MAQTKLIIAFFFLAIILAQKIQSTEGRNLKFKNRNAFQTRAKISRQDSVKFTKHRKNLPTDCSSMTVCGNKAAFTPPSPAATESQPPPPGHADDFRPTTPGHSPGIGHSL
ncbi:hypothetical protein Pfo_008705 [Paulownia fortunei]|nr:hypothetical protein Pfo_008705 [Paulownia fortunei]